MAGERVIFRLHPQAFRPALFPSPTSRATSLSSKPVEVFLLILHRMSVSGIPCVRSKGRWADNQSGGELALLRQKESSMYLL